ncbi:MAG: PrgI family protein [Oscillospiraceae bacterium]
MAYVQIPRDLSKVKEKFLFGLTKRQVVFFGIGAVFGAIMFFVLKGISLTTGITGLMLMVMPFGFMGIYEKNGLPFEKHLRNYIKANLRPKLRLYKSENLYVDIEEQIYFEKEAKRVGYKRSFKDRLIKAFEAADKIQIGKKKDI